MSLPSGYKRLEYIESTGTQYINTGLHMTSDMDVFIDFHIQSSETSNFGIFGARDPGELNGYMFFTQNRSLMCMFSRTYLPVFTDTSQYTNRHTLKKIGSTVTVDDVATTLQSESFVSANSAFIFCFAEAATPSSFIKMRLYSMQISNGGVLLRDFVPCNSPSGVAGLYDLVGKQFYGNAGTGAFTAGPVLAIAVDASEITKLEYIQSSGTQWVDTGFKPNQDTRLVMEFSMTSTSKSSYVAGVTDNTNYFRLFSQSGGAGIQDFYGTTNYILSATMTARNVIDKNKNNTTIGTSTYNHTEQTFSIGYNIALFTDNVSGTFNTSRPAQMKLYSCQIYDNGTLVRDYIAAKLSDGTVGIYDKLHGMLYTNIGTGTFTAGPEVGVPTPENFRLSSSTDVTATLAWDAVTDATGYKLYRNGSLVTILFSNSYTDTIKPFTDYVYTLTAYNENGESTPATLDVFVIIPPVQPKYFNFIGANNSNIWLSWQSVNHADTYKLYRDDTLLHETKDTKYIDTGLNVNTQYNYTLVASNSSGDSPKSSILKASTISLDLVYDRTQEDGNKIAQYIQTKFSNLSEEQQAEWLSYHSKGGWNYTDLNRIEYWIGYITELLGLYIESLDDIPKFEASWDKRSNLYVEDVTYIQKVVELLKTKFKLTEFDWEIMQRGPNWDYKQANAIERNLKTLYEQFYYMYIWPICGDTTCGGDYL